MQYHQACNCKLEKGLYIAYVKLKSSIDMMSVMVNSNQPNILPIAKIRNNPHVSRQEWAALKMCLKPKSNHHHHHQQQQNDLNDNHDGQNEDNGDDDDKQTWRRLVTSVSQLHLQLVNNTHHQQSETNSRNQKSKTHHSSSCSPNFLSTTSSINNHKTSLSSSDLMNQITTIPTPLSSPMTQTGPGFVDNFFQLACQHEQQQQQIVKLSSSDQQQTLEKDDGGCITTTTNIERIEKPKTLSVVNQQSSRLNINQIQKPQRLTFGQKMCFQQLTKFLQILSHTAAHFLQSIGIDEDKHLNINRIYTVEIIELDGQVSLILLLPPSDEVCSITQSDLDINQRFDDLLFLPLKIFELSKCFLTEKHQNNFSRFFLEHLNSSYEYISKTFYRTILASISIIRIGYNCCTTSTT